MIKKVLIIIAVIVLLGFGTTYVYYLTTVKGAQAESGEMDGATSTPSYFSWLLGGSSGDGSSDGIFGWMDDVVGGGDDGVYSPQEIADAIGKFDGMRITGTQDAGGSFNMECTFGDDVEDPSDDVCKMTVAAGGGTNAVIETISLTDANGEPAIYMKGIIPDGAWYKAPTGGGAVAASAAPTATADPAVMGPTGIVNLLTQGNAQKLADDNCYPTRPDNNTKCTVYSGVFDAGSAAYGYEDPVVMEMRLNKKTGIPAAMIINSDGTRTIVEYEFVNGINITVPTSYKNFPTFGGRLGF